MGCIKSYFCTVKNVSDDDSNHFSKIDHISGLRNIGNTCYFNTAM